MALKSFVLCSWAAKWESENSRCSWRAGLQEKTQTQQGTLFFFTEPQFLTKIQDLAVAPQDESSQTAGSHRESLDDHDLPGGGELK